MWRPALRPLRRSRRVRSGIMANTSYQFSKSIDNAGTGGRGQGNTPVAQNWLDLSAERGLSSFDARHNLSVRFQYSSGMDRAGGTLVNGWKGALMKDWTVSGDISLRSGTPLTAPVGGNLSQVSGTAVSNTPRAAGRQGPVVRSPGYVVQHRGVRRPGGCTVGECGEEHDPQATGQIHTVKALAGSLCQTSAAPSNAQEQFSAVHPKENQPVHQQYRRASQQRLVGRSEELKCVRAKMNAKGIHDEPLPQMRHQVGGDGVHTDHHQRKGPFPIAFHLNQPAKPGQEQEAQSTAEKRPTRRPDALHHRADAGVVQHKAGSDSHGVGGEQAP